MYCIKKLFLFTAAVTFAVMGAAQAEVYKWRDPDVKLSVTFPDDWHQLAGQQPDDVLTVAAPVENSFASCRMRIKEDRRFMIYPRDFAGAIQRTAVSHDFWEKYVGEFRAADLHLVGDDAGLGNGFASWADISFISPAGPKVQMRGFAYATTYNDHAYVFECSAEASVYDKFYHPFLSILKSVDMRAEYPTTVNGYYRDFQNDNPLRIHGEKDVDLFVY